MTTFIIRAVEKEVRRVEAEPVSSTTVPHRAPTFFRALCAEAGRGGTTSYEHVGREFGSCMAQLLWESDPNLEPKLQELRGLLRTGRPQRRFVTTDALTVPDEAVWAWCEREFPKYTKLIPSRRRSRFLSGIYAVHEERDVTVY